jgi:signal transduction histidine kinase
MQERAKEMNGDFQVRSTPGAGTEITLTIPLAAQ